MSLNWDCTVIGDKGGSSTKKYLEIPFLTLLHLKLNAWLETQIFNGHFFKDYQHIENNTESGLIFYTQSDVSCCVYDVKMMDANPSLTSNFIHDLEHLSDEYVEYIYRK